MQHDYLEGRIQKYEIRRAVPEEVPNVDSLTCGSHQLSHLLSLSFHLYCEHRESLLVRMPSFLEKRSKRNNARSPRLNPEMCEASAARFLKIVVFRSPSRDYTATRAPAYMPAVRPRPNGSRGQLSVLRQSTESAAGARRDSLICDSATRSVSPLGPRVAHAPSRPSPFPKRLSESPASCSHTRAPGFTYCEKPGSSISR